MPAGLLESQVETLERSAEVVEVDATKDVEDVVRQIVAKLGLA